MTVAIDAAADTVGTAVVQADGSWSVTADLGALAQGAHTEIATVQGAQYLTTTADEGFTVNTAGPAVTFNTGVAFSHPTKATLTGTVSDPTGVTSLEVFSGSKDLGAATIHKNGNWTFAATLSRGFHDAISVEATDGIGNTSSTPAPFELQTGIRGQLLHDPGDRSEQPWPGCRRDLHAGRWRRISAGCHRKQAERRLDRRLRERLLFRLAGLLLSDV